ncbi:MAG: NADH-quinone oxidoreductase subunit C [Clostridia bacterium]|nr:NADH-quinone oxidoreductase subunit C [Clostridia bacterium]
MPNKVETASIGPAVLKQYMKEAAAEGCRLVQIHANRTSDGYQLIYSIASGYHLINLEMVISEDTEVESISGIYPAAQLYEQEMAELFGVRIIGIPEDPRVKLYHVQGHPMK